MVTRSRSKIPPNDWVEYVDATTGELLHVDEFFNPFVARGSAPEELVRDAVWEEGQ
jgi:hypothetical protein